MYKYGAASTVVFKAVDSTDGITAKTGLTSSTLLCYISKDGGAFNACTNAASEIGRGWYKLVITATEMQAESIALDFTATGAIVAGIPIHTEADYTAARAAFLDAAISSRSAGGDTSGTTTLLGRLTSTRAGLLDNLDATVSSRSTYAGGAVASVTAGVTVTTNNDKTGYALSSAYDPAKTAAQAGNAMTLTSGERTTLAAAIWNALTSGMTTAGSIGKKLADWVIGTTQTGDAFARLGAPSGASVSADIAAISVATNASGLATKEADSATLTTGTTISGTYASTATNDAVYWITAPVTPAVGGFGLRERLVFDLPLGRTPVGIQVRGYFSGSGAVVDVYALNSRTAAFDKLTNTNTNLASRNSDALYAIPLPRDYADDSGGAFNVITLEFRSASTNTTHRLRLDQVLIAHVAEDVAVTSTAPTAEQIWSYVTRELTTPGADPVTVPTVADIRAEMDANSTKLAHLDADISSRLAAGTVASDVTAIKAKSDLIPASPAAVSDIPTAAAIADQVWDEAIAGHAGAGSTGAALDAASSSGSSAPSAAAIADEVQTRTIAAVTLVNGLADNTLTAAALAADAVTEIQSGLATAAALAAVKAKTDPLTFTIANKLDANIHAVNDVNVRGTGAPGDTWGP